MHIKSYLDLYQSLDVDTSSQEDRRAFGLSHSHLKHQPIEQVLLWLKTREKTLPRPLLSDTFARHLYGLTFVLVSIAFVVGIFSGTALLHYNGNAPVNVVYFIAVVVFFPLFTMCLSLFSMLKAHQSQSVFIHISPSYWVEKMASFLPNHFEYDKNNLEINPLLANWIVIKRAQFIALFFSLGLVLSLLFVIMSKDIAFAWSTTLDMTPEGFHAFVSMIAVPWESFFPETVPSLVLIEQSHYFRLGDGLSQEMINNASHLGQWWQFLLMATLFYALFLRVLLYAFSFVGLHKALKKSFLDLEGVAKLLSDMNEAIISTHSMDIKQNKERVVEGSLEKVASVAYDYDAIQAWAMSGNQLILLNDMFSIHAKDLYEVGGMNSLEEDSLIVSKSYGKVLLYVKAWEPPTMDFIDYLEELLEKVESIIIVPIGTKENAYVPRDKAIKVWERKLGLFNNPKVYFKVSKVENT
jgi:hypothetical protein